MKNVSVIVQIFNYKAVLQEWAVNNVTATVQILNYKAVLQE